MSVKLREFWQKHWDIVLAGALVLILVVAFVVLSVRVLNPAPDDSADFVENQSPEITEMEISEVEEPVMPESVPDEVLSPTYVASSPGDSYVEAVPASAAAAAGNGSNCSLALGNLMLINPNFTVSTDFIAARRSELISLASTYGIPEFHAYNGDNLLDPTAAVHLNDMVKAYQAEYPGHTMGTMSCFRQRGTSCGRLCLATGTSEHHSGYTCDLIDTAYGSSLDTDTYDAHLEWQWLKANSYKYGFIDRYPEEWAGGPMSAPMNVDANGTTGLHETWHYRYVGLPAAYEIATGRYNNGAYDSLEHYLFATGRLADLVAARCN